MLRPGVSSLASALAIVALVAAACGSGASPTKAPAASSPQATPAVAVASPTLAASPSSAIVYPTPVAPAGIHNGRIAAGVRAADGSANIFAALADGSDVRQLTTGTGNHLCAAYSADGNLMAYCADVSGSFEIWTMKPDGSQQKQVTDLGGRALFPDISPDGKKIAFAGTEGADPRTEVYVVDAATGTDLVALTSCANLKPGCSNDYPAWSPDGSLIVYIHADDFNADETPVNAQVWVMNADGSNQRQLTTDSPAKDQVPSWSPDGAWITYASGEGVAEGIWVMAADGSSNHQLTGCRPGDPTPCATGSDFGPVWSPDGTRIAFLRSFMELGTNDRPVFVMNADGSDQHRLTAGTILQAVPAWQARGVGEVE